MKNLHSAKKITVLVKNGWVNNRQTNVCVDAAKKRISNNFELRIANNLEQHLIDYAIEKMYGKGKFFMLDNSGIDGRGQIWQHSPDGGSDSITGMVEIDTEIIN